MPVNLDEEWPDGKYGGPRPKSLPTSPAQAAAHRAALLKALRRPPDTEPVPRQTARLPRTAA